MYLHKVVWDGQKRGSQLTANAHAEVG
jgi:hypothetical protein